MNDPFTVVLTDDDEDESLFFHDAISVIGQNIVLQTFENGEQLLIWLNESDSLPDVIFLDINMPYINGFEALQEIKKDARLKEIPVIIYSTSTNHLDIQKAYAYGAVLYLCKLITIHDLPDKLKHIIEGIKNHTLFQEKPIGVPAF